MRDWINIIINGTKKNSYLLIPMICILSWSIYYLLKQSISPVDFRTLYWACRAFLSNPADLYKPGYRVYHLPSFIMLIAVSVCLFPFNIAQYIFYVIITFI